MTKKTNHAGMVCDCVVIHKDVVARARASMPDAEQLFSLSDFFNILSDSTRVRILWALSISEMCVCDLCAFLDMTPSAVSHQLKNLRQGHLVRYRKSGKIVYYSLSDDHINVILGIGMTHIREERMGRSGHA